MNPRERFLQTAITLFSRQGYHATGLNEIVAVSGAPKGSLYHYFPGGKEQLALEAIRAEQIFVHGVLDETLGKSDSAVVAIQSFILVLSEHYSLHFKEKGDPFSHLSMSLLALESASLGDRLRLACVEAFQDWVGVYAAKLRMTGLDEARAQDLGLLIQTMVEGAVTLAVTRQDTRPLLNLIHHIPVLVQGNQ